MTYAPSLYANSAKVDEKTGLPADYDSLFASYRDLVLGAASRLKIPQHDLEDSAQEVQLKFWAKNGLDLFDPTKKTKFATLYRQWSTMFLLQERDKSIRYGTRNFLCDSPTELEPESIDRTQHFEDDLVSNTFLNNWIEQAKAELIEHGYSEFVPLLVLCYNSAQKNTAPTRAEIAQTMGRSINSATDLLKKMREILKELGMGEESLHA